MLIKKKEMIAAALVVLIGCAGYLNWSYQDTMTVRDGESYIETGRRLGEAQLVNSEAEVEENDEAKDTEDVFGGEDEGNKDEENKAEENQEEGQENSSGNAEYFENAKYERENARSKAMEILNQTCSNSSFDDETRKKAGEKILEETNYINAEQEIENIAGSKGYSEVCAYVKEDGATITVRKENFSAEDALRLSEIARDQTGYSANVIKIVEVK
jgi:stage III sporulation protein AH